MEARDVNILGGVSGRFFDNSSRSGFGRRSRDDSSAFEFGGRRSTEYHGDNDSTKFDMNTGVTDSSTENLFSSRRGGFGNTQAQQLGSVKRWSAERGFGFIRRTNGGPDLFCHVRSLRNGLEELEEGQQVQYRIQRTDKGEEARDVSIFDENVSSSVDSTERQTGTVKRWIAEKGYGFIQLNQGGADVFVSLRDLPEGTSSLTEGQVLEFNVKSTGKGQVAENVTIQN